MSNNTERPPSIPPPLGYPSYCKGLNDNPREYTPHHLKLYMYIWLGTGMSYWFYPTSIKEEDGTCTGYAWRNNQHFPVTLNYDDIYYIY